MFFFINFSSCYCMIQYEGLQCDIANFSYHVAFTSIFRLVIEISPKDTDWKIRVFKLFSFVCFRDNPIVHSF